MKKLFHAVLAWALLAIPALGADTPLPNPNIRFGMPAPAGDTEKHREAYLISREQYVLSYNADKLIPNWVCWRLTKEDIGNAARAAFEPDPALPRWIAKVHSDVYTGSGFDRGHMCAAKDRSRSPADSRATFYTTNIIPQSPNCNQKGWERLEDYSRRLAKEGYVLYIACGPVGVGGTGKEGKATEISRRGRNVTVPAKVWKVILVLPNEKAEPRKNTRVIAVIMPNDQSVDYDWFNYRKSAREIEKLTGYRFFSTLPTELADELRDHVDKVEVREPKTRPR